MIDQLQEFALQVTLVAKETGTEGRLGGQAVLPGVSGIWAELTENVNVMSAQLTEQVRDIAKVTTAVARGDLTQKVSADCKGEILELKVSCSFPTVDGERRDFLARNLLHADGHSLHHSSAQSSSTCIISY